jgi:hypothetical protein
MQKGDGMSLYKALIRNFPEETEVTQETGEIRELIWSEIYTHDLPSSK